MPRFSQWARERPETSLEADYLVDNRQLQSKSNGILFRQRPELSLKATKLAQFGTTVRGVPYNAEWLEVDGLYLPMSVDGVEVLVRMGAVEEQQEAEHDAPEDSSLPAWLLGKPAVGNRAAGNKKQRPAEIFEDFRMPRPPAVGVGPGEWYEVIAERAVIRSNPSVNAHIENIKNRGEFVELFEWDDKQEWRRCKDSWQAGWMLLRHASLGQILMPVEPTLLPSVTPMCAAIMTNDMGSLRVWLSQVPNKDFRRLGPAALTMAAARGFLDCFVVILEAGADPEVILAAGQNSAGFREPAATQALARALSGQDFQMADFDAALAKLEPAQQQLAERLFDQAAENLKASRQGQSRFAYAAEESEEEDRRGPEDGWEDEAEQREYPRQDTTAAKKKASPPRGQQSDLAEVLARRVAVRCEPEFSADILAEFRQGDQATLLDYDPTNTWRRVRAKDTNQYGWTLLNHKALGALWRVLGQPQGKAKEEEEDEEETLATQLLKSVLTGGAQPSRKETEDWDDVFGK